MTSRATRWGRIAVWLSILLMSVPGAAQKHHEADKKPEHFTDLPAVIWRDPGDISKVDLINGAGGKPDAPDGNGHFTFVKEDLKESNPKFDVKDEQGRTWRVKLGPEFSRRKQRQRVYFFAVGYFVDEDYYFPAIRVGQASAVTSRRPVCVHRRNGARRSIGIAAERRQEAGRLGLVRRSFHRDERAEWLTSDDVFDQQLGT